MRLTVFLRSAGLVFGLIGVLFLFLGWIQSIAVSGNAEGLIFFIFGSGVGVFGLFSFLGGWTIEQFY